MSDEKNRLPAGRLHPLTYQGVAIRHRGEMLNLTDMWTAAGSNPAKRPADWARKEGADFIRHVSDMLNMPVGHIQTQRGGSGANRGSTFAHWQIGLAYAKYLSPEFHMWCNTVVRDRMEGRLVPAAGTVTALDEQVRATIGGIAKAVLTKALDERLLPVERAVLTISERVSLLTQDPSAHVTTEYRPVLAVVAEMGVPAKGRRGLCQRISRAMATWCLREMRQADVRLSKETNRRLFHVTAIDDWMKAEGNVMVAEHKARLAGQSVMAFRPRPKPVTEPAGEGA